MPYGKDAGIAKVLKGDGPHHAGMGIAIDRRHVMTCAHVVNTAVGWPIEGTTRPTVPISVRFPLSMSPRAIDGTVVAWHPIGDATADDVAVLEFAEDIPDDVGTVIFAQLHRPLDRDPLNVFGIAAGEDVGNHVATRFVGHSSGTTVQIEGAAEPGVFIQGGFSGAAVWDAVHQAVVGMTQAKREGSRISTAYMMTTPALRAAWPALPVEDRRLPKSFNWIWTAVTSLLLLLMLYAHVTVQTDANRPQLAAFFGMHVFAVLGPTVAWLWYLHARDFKLHDWPARMPGFADVKTDPNSAAQKTLWVLSLLFLVLIPTYIQGHLLKTFHDKGSVYIYAKKFGYEQQLERPNGIIRLRVGPTLHKCFDRSNILCEHPDADRYSTVAPKPPSSGSWWETYWDNAYHYGDLERDGRHGSVTFWPILQPLVVLVFSALALAIFAAVFCRLFFRRASAAQGRRIAAGATSAAG